MQTVINMAEKKETAKKTAKVAKKVQPVKKSQVKTEQQFFAKDLAEKMGIASFDFLLIKREAGIEDGSPITRSKMQELYDKIIRR